MSESPRVVRFFESVRRRRIIVLAAFAAVFILGTIAGKRIEWREDVADLLPDGDPVVRDYTRLLETFRPADRTYIVVGPADEKNPPTRQTLFDAVDLIAARLQEHAGPSSDTLIRKVVARSDPAQALAVLDWMHRHRASYFSQEDRRRADERMQPDAIRRALAEWRRQMMISPTPTLGRRLASDPLGFDGFLAERLTSLRSMGGGVQVRDGRLMSADGRHALILAEPRWPSTDSLHAAAYIKLLDDAIREAQAASQGRVRAIYLSGHRFSLENAARMKADIRTVLLLSVVGVSILAFFALGRLGAVVLVLLPAAFGATFSLGILGVVWPGISAIALGCGAMLTGISVDYGIHLLYHVAGARHGDLPGASVPSRVVSRLAQPLVLSAATTIVAFSVLSSSTLPGYRQLGIFSALGILGASAFAILALPCLIGSRGSHVVGRLQRPLGAFFLAIRNVIGAHRTASTVVVLGVSALLAGGLPMLTFQGDYRELNGISEESREEWRAVERVFGDALDSAMAAVRAPDAEEALQENETVDRALRGMRDDNLVRAYRSIAPVWPSMATRRENRRRWIAFWSAERIDALEKNLAEAANEAGMRAEAFGPFIESLRARPPAPPERGGVPELLDEGIRAQMVAGADGASLLTPFRLGNEEQLDAAAQRLRREAPGVMVASGRHLLAHMVRVIARELRRVAVLAMIGVSIVLWIAWRRLRRVAAFMAPVALSAVWTLGFLGIAGVEINLMNSIVCVFIFGLVVDYSVFMLSAIRAERRGDHLAFASAAGSVAISALTTIVALGALAAARHPALRSVGLTALVGVAGGWLAVLVGAALAGGRLSAPQPDSPRRES